jgi:DHA2 family multidrug resistance protein-like MFS transporter
MLIITRAVLGVVGATLAPSTLSLIRNMFLDPDQRAFAIGVWATSFAAGAAIGPLAGGLSARVGPQSVHGLLAVQAVACAEGE